MKDTKNKKNPGGRNFGINIVAVDETGEIIGLDASGQKLDSIKPDDRVYSSRALPKDSKIQLKMLFPEEKDLNLVKANGTVKWVKQVKAPGGKYFLIGVHFLEAGDREKEKITKLWKSHRRS